jgi:hypothetical protein
MSLQIDLVFRVLVQDIKGGDAVSDSGSVIETSITFKTKRFKVAELKLSEVRALLGGDSTDYRDLEALALAESPADGPIPDVRASVTQEVFIAWAQTFGNSQSLAILNAISPKT